MAFMCFYPDDWLYDTRILDDKEKSVWIDLLCFMWNAPERGKLEGHPQDLARMVGREWGEFEVIINGIKNKKVADVTVGNEKVTVISRRMVREENRRESNRLRKRKFDNEQRNAKVTDKKLRNEEAKKLRSKDKDIGHNSFQKPSTEEIATYCEERHNNVEASRFFDYYEACGWRVGRNPMKNWKAAVRTWEKNNFSKNGNGGLSWQEKAAAEIQEKLKARESKT